MKQKKSAIEKMLALSVAFTLILLAFRIALTNDLYYGFYVWNIFLAILPFLFSRQLIRKEKINVGSVLLLAGWLLFFPNAPYIITDIIHFRESTLAPRWFDLLLVMSATWNGLVLGMVSLMQVEKFLMRHMKKIWVYTSVFASMLLCGYGIFLGRFLRFNSWDIITNPDDLLYASAHQVLHPVHYIRTWGFTFLFASMLCIIYFTIKQLPRLYDRGSSSYSPELF